MSFSTILSRSSARTRATTLKLLSRAYPPTLFRPAHMTTAPLPPFDTDTDTSLERFAPCHDAAVYDNKQPNGFIPCSKHPIPRAVSKIIDLTEPMELSKAYRRHLVVCVGEDGPEWMRAKVESVEGGIVATMQELKKESMVREREKREIDLKVDAAEGQVMIHSKKDEADGENKMKSLVGDFKASVAGRGEKSDPTATAPDDDLFVTVCDRVQSERNPLTIPWPTSDILLFPDFKLFHDIEPHSHSPSTPSTLSILMNSLGPHPTDPSQLLESLPHRDLRTTTHAIILVCTHTCRDKRCGVLGSSIVNEFKTVLARKGILIGGVQAGLEEEEDVKRAREMTGGKVVEVYGTSHVGGHKFAGNVIIHMPELGGQVYGNVRPCHVESIVDRHILGGKVLRKLWRGQIQGGQEGIGSP